jgi:hypothetical protein
MVLRRSVAHRWLTSTMSPRESPAAPALLFTLAAWMWSWTGGLERIAWNSPSRGLMREMRCAGEDGQPNRICPLRSNTAFIVWPHAESSE